MFSSTGSSLRRKQARFRLSGLLLFVICVLLWGAAGQSQQTSTFSVKVKVVNMLATVRDKHGLMVRNLTKDDFILEEDDRPQAIRYFTQDTDIQLTLGLLVDTSMSQMRLLDRERSASHTFLNQMMRENKDSAFVIHFDSQVELLQDATGSRQKLEEALGVVEMTPPEPQNTASSPGSWPGRRRGGWGGAAGTLLYDSVFLASDELMSKQQGRKALILLTDGVDQGSKLGLQTAIASAQRADTVVYSILFADDQDTAADLVALNSLGNQLDRSTGKSHIGWNGFLNDYPNILSRAAAVLGARNLFRLKARPPSCPNFFHLLFPIES